MYFFAKKYVSHSEDLREIDAAFAGVTIEGGRMNLEQMQVVDTHA